jgi:hypothetical protein
MECPLFMRLDLSLKEYGFFDAGRPYIGLPTNDFLLVHKAMLIAVLVIVFGEDFLGIKLLKIDLASISG